MWYGKIAIIMFLFSFATTFSMYYINTLYNDPTLSSSYQLANVSALAANWTSVQNQYGSSNVNAALIFGDFLIGVKVLFSVLSGAGVVSVLQGIPGIDNSVLLLVQILYGSSSIILWVYVVANRSL